MGSQSRLEALPGFIFIDVRQILAPFVMNFGLEFGYKFADRRICPARYAAPRTCQEPAENLPRTCQEPAEIMPRTCWQTRAAKPRTQSSPSQNDEAHHKRLAAKLGDGGWRAAWRLRISSGASPNTVNGLTNYVQDHDFLIGGGKAAGSSRAGHS